MFYSNFLFVKKGPLSKVWIAAHYNRKLTKNHVVGTDIDVSAKSILMSETPLALRLRGQLLLGLVRIYQRKVKYLEEDCYEAMTKMKMIFRPGVVDLPTEAITVPSNQITFADNFEGLDFELPEPTLTEFDNFLADATEVEVSFSGSFAAPSVTLETKRQDITLSREEISLSQLGIGLDDMYADNLSQSLRDLPMDDDGDIFGDESVEVGRDAGPAQDVSLGFDADADVSLGLTPGDMNATKESFMLGDISGVDTTVGDFDVDRLSTDSAMLPVPTPVDQKKRKKKRKLLRKDVDTQISSSDFKRNLKDASPTVNKEWESVPLSKRAKRDALFHQLGFSSYVRLPSTISGASLDLRDECAPALLDLFRQLTKPGQAREIEEEKVQDEDQFLQEESMFDHDLEGFDTVASISAADESALSSVGPVSPERDLESAARDAEFWSEAPQGEENKVESIAGWSERTVKMHKVLEPMLKETPRLSFEKVVEDKPRQTAAGVFYQLLVLKTHSFINVEQPEPFDDITISKDKFKQKLPKVSAE